MLGVKRRGAAVGIMRRANEKSPHMMMGPHANRLPLPDLGKQAEVLGSIEEEGEAEEEDKLGHPNPVGLPALRLVDLESMAKHYKILKLRSYLMRNSLKQSKSCTHVILIQNKNFHQPIVSQ